MSDDRVFAAVSRYVQGWGATDRIGDYTRHLGARCAVMVDAQLFAAFAPRLEAALSRSGIRADMSAVGGEVTIAAITAEAHRVRSSAPDFVVGAGGGKTIDIAKGIAHSLYLPIVTVPTIASNDSPASRVIAIYDEQHQLSEVAKMQQNPACVVVDTEVIAAAPARFLSAGIGDALAKYAEAKACAAAEGISMQGTRPLASALIIAEGCHRILRASAVSALNDLTTGRSTRALEETIEAVVLLSALAFENGGLSIAHAVTRGLMATPGASQRLHGEQVAYGLLVQLTMEGVSDTDLGELLSFLEEARLPRSLSHLDTESSDETLHAIAAATMTAPHTRNAPKRVDEQSIFAALQAVERLTTGIA